MVTYDLMKSWWLARLERDAVKANKSQPQLDSYHYSVFSSLSKILAVVCTYPFQLVRARIQGIFQLFYFLLYKVFYYFLLFRSTRRL